MPRNRIRWPNKRRKYAAGKVKSKTSQSVKSTEVDSTIDDLSCIDKHHDNEHNPVASVTTTNVHDILSPLTSSPDSSHNHGLSTPVSVRNKENRSPEIGRASCRYPPMNYISHFSNYT